MFLLGISVAGQVLQFLLARAAFPSYAWLLAGTRKSLCHHPPTSQTTPEGSQDLPGHLFSIPYSPLPTGDYITGSSCQEALCRRQPEIALFCPAATLPSRPALPHVCHRKQSHSLLNAELLHVLAHHYRVLLWLLLHQVRRT